MNTKSFLRLMGVLTSLSMLYTGCSNTNVTADVKDTVVETRQVSTKTNFSEMIPNPEEYFNNTDFEYVTSDNSYIVWVDYASEDEWNTYIDECKKTDIWTDETYKSNYSWYVNSDDGKYNLALDRYGEKNEYLTIVVKEVE